tara:strand:- start:4359 stop:4796 length:438 start_codon:yes stop_codon:yes gene_type:complete
MEDLIRIYNQVNNFGRDNHFELNIIEEGLIHYEMTIEKKHLATPTAAHGGVIAAFMDAVIGVAALSAIHKEGKLASTIEFKISYYQPALLGDKLKGIGTVDKKGKRIIFTTGEIYNQHNKLIAKATGTLNAYPFEKGDIANILKK